VSVPAVALNAPGARRWRGGLLAALAFTFTLILAVAGVVAPAGAEPGPRQVPLPPGLASVWRVDGRKVDTFSAAWSLAAFSTDGKLVGVADDGGARVYDASDGRLVRMVPAPYSTGQFAFSLALSSTGLVALGRVGGVEVYSIDERGEPLKFFCGGICGPVSALAFSPNGAWLASQAARSTLEAPGLVNVVDLSAGVRTAELEASATRAGVMFAADGGALIAANVTRIDGTGTFGMRRFSTAAAWRRTRDVAGAQVPRGSVGPYAFNERVAAYAFRGNVELRDIATGALVWARPFVPPGLDSATEDAAMKLELVAFAPRGDLMLGYESPVDSGGPGALVLRRMADGDVVAVYDVVGLSALAISPDGERFMYSTGVGRTYTVLARVPR